MKRIIELKISRTGDTTGWDNVDILYYHASSELEACNFADAIATYNKAQVRWNWMGSINDHYTYSYKKELVYG